MLAAGGPSFGWTACLVGALTLQAAAIEAQVAYTGSTYVVRAHTADGGRTDAVYILNSVDLERGPIRASIVVPVVVQRSTLTAPDAAPYQTPWDAGAGDMTLRLDGSVWRSAGRQTSVRMSGTVTVPTGRADDGFSAGRTNWAVGASWRQMRGRHSLVADASYWMIGDTADTDFRNIPSLYAGYGRILDRGFRSSLVISAGLTPSPIPGLPPAGQAGVALLRAVGSSAALGIAASVGLTEGAADLAIGATWRVAF